ncbi:MAG: MaoC family dehydratase, partial [Candidatus Dormibacteraeota bacterium]|nr:MaoC family dehydratase [Candidatus Dormibacteraeota bacterium]
MPHCAHPRRETSARWSGLYSPHRTRGGPRVPPSGGGPHRAVRENVLELIAFEDLPLGASWLTRRRTILESDVAGYLGLAGDYNPLYADAMSADAGPYRGLVAPAVLISAVAMGLGSMDVPQPRTTALVGLTWRFRHPVRPGDTLRTRWRLNRKRDSSHQRWGLATWQVEVENQHAVIVAVGEVQRLVERRLPAAAGVPTPAADLPVADASQAAAE